MIEIGEYVRSKIGSIGKVTRIEDNKFLYENKTLITWVGNVVKHSKNIIDLIEVGDYVNGNKVVQTYKDSKKQDEIYLEVVVSSIMIKEPLTDYIEEDRIKDILTKEQYMQNCYTMERNEKC